MNSLIAAASSREILVNCNPTTKPFSRLAKMLWTTRTGTSNVARGSFLVVIMRRMVQVAPAGALTDATTDTPPALMSCPPTLKGGWPGRISQAADLNFLRSKRRLSMPCGEVEELSGKGISLLKNDLVRIKSDCPLASGNRPAIFCWHTLNLYACIGKIFAR